MAAGSENVTLTEVLVRVSRLEVERWLELPLGADQGDRQVAVMLMIEVERDGDLADRLVGMAANDDRRRREVIGVPEPPVPQLGIGQVEVARRSER